uniref:Uncharacterized protein n=1 Tax=Ditylenchus dipsaci TaxID=166011 RepID=A0A915CWY8_9BILA
MFLQFFYLVIPTCHASLKKTVKIMTIPNKEAQTITVNREYSSLADLKAEVEKQIFKTGGIMINKIVKGRRADIKKKDYEKVKKTPLFGINQDTQLKIR